MLHLPMRISVIKKFNAADPAKNSLTEWGDLHELLTIRIIARIGAKANSPCRFTEKKYREIWEKTTRKIRYRSKTIANVFAENRALNYCDQEPETLKWYYNKCVVIRIVLVILVTKINHRETETRQIFSVPP